MGDFFREFFEYFLECIIVLFSVLGVLASVAFFWIAPIVAALYTGSFSILFTYLISIPMGYGLLRAFFRITN
jgi:hypothetical protein